MYNDNYAATDPDMNFLIGVPDTVTATIEQNIAYAVTPNDYHGFNENEVVHWACTFDVNGINNSDTTVIVYKNGVVIAAAEGLKWAPHNVGAFWLGAYAMTVWMQSNIRNLAYGPANGVYDNLKIWNYAKTDFSDRFFE
jgi:hypothetical protein